MFVPLSKKLQETIELLALVEDLPTKSRESVVFFLGGRCLVGWGFGVDVFVFQFFVQFFSSFGQRGSLVVC